MSPNNRNSSRIARSCHCRKARTPRATPAPMAKPIPRPLMVAQAEIDQRPAPAEGADVVQTEQSESQEDERKCSAVVEPALTGQREAQVVAVMGTAQLHVRGQHRVRGRQRRAQQQRKSGRHPQPPVGGGRNAGDGQHQREGREPERQTPAPVAHGNPHLDAHGEQRNQQCDLGHQLEHFEFAHGMQFERVDSGGPEREPDHQVDHRGDRQPIEKPPEQCDGDQQDSESTNQNAPTDPRLSVEGFRCSRRRRHWRRRATRAGVRTWLAFPACPRSPTRKSLFVVSLAVAVAARRRPEGRLSRRASILGPGATRPSGLSRP